MEPKEIVEVASVGLTVGLGALFLLVPRFTAARVGFGKVSAPYTGLRSLGGMMAALGGYAWYIGNDATFAVLAIAWIGAGAANLFALILEDEAASRAALVRLFVALAVGGALYYFVAVA